MVIKPATRTVYTASSPKPGLSTRSAPPASTAPIHNSSQRTAPRAHAPASTTAAPVSNYIWDNWPVNLDRDATCLGRFSLEAPRRGPPESRHENARIALFLPAKDGSYAKFCDVVDTAPAWSGSALNLSEIGRAHDLNGLNSLRSCRADAADAFCSTALNKFLNTAIVLPYTSRTSVITPWGFAVGHAAPQAISLCYKRAGSMAFEVHGEVLNPHRRDDANLRYYKTDDSPFVISAWRDPFIFVENNQYHMFFSARYSRAFYDEMSPEMQHVHTAHLGRNGTAQGYHDDINSAIGWATSEDLISWSLQKPLSLPGNGAQFELPTCTRVGNSHVLTTAVCDGCVTSTNVDQAQSLFGPRRQYLAAFKTDAALSDVGQSGAWTALADRINRETHPLQKTYGLTFRGVGEKVFATAFDDRAFTFTSIVEMSRDAFPFNIPAEHDQSWGLNGHTT